jgi:hypothetical protein
VSTKSCYKFCWSKFCFLLGLVLNVCWFSAHSYWRPRTQCVEEKQKEKYTFWSQNTVKWLCRIFMPKI